MTRPPCPHCGAAPGEPHRCCAVCQRVHPRNETCDGRPIDWPAREARARAWRPGKPGKPSDYEVER